MDWEEKSLLVQRRITGVIGSLVMLSWYLEAEVRWEDKGGGVESQELVVRNVEQVRFALRAMVEVLEDGPVASEIIQEKHERCRGGARS